MDCLGQLTEEELTTTQVLGHWTVKDVVAHIWSWADEAVLTAKAWRDRRPWQEGVTYDDAWNEQQARDRSALPLISVVDGLTAAHRRMMHVLDTVDDDLLAAEAKAPWGETLSLLAFFYGMSEHYIEHAKALRTYQEHCLEGCD
jgi:hypothetical protein